MSGVWLNMDDRGATAMKYALIAILLVLAVYHG